MHAYMYKCVYVGEFALKQRSNHSRKYKLIT